MFDVELSRTVLVQGAVNHGESQLHGLVTTAAYKGVLTNISFICGS